MKDKKRLIDANALKEQIAKEIHTYWTNGTGGYCLAEDAIADIDNAPTVDAVEVVHARWIDVRQYCGDYMCSNCKELSRTKTYNYCPGCGADMKENKLNLEDVFDIEAQTKANNDAMRKAISFMVSGAKMDGERKE